MAYFPNGCAGEILDNQCVDCPLGDGPCPVSLIQMMYNYDQLADGQEKLKEAMSYLVDDKGICEVRKQILANVTRTSERIDETESEDQEGWCGHCACQSCYDAKRKADHW